MTIWGPAQADSTNAFRIGYDVSYSPSIVGTGTSSVTVLVTLRLGTQYFANDSSVSWSIGGSFSPGSGTHAFDHNSSTPWSPSNETVIGTTSRVVSTSYTGAVTGSTTASVTGLAAIAGTASVTVNWSVPKRPVSAPAAPTACDWTRVSDTQHTVTWTNTSPTNAAAPYTNVQVERQTNDGAWARIATLGVASSYSDKGTVANRKYRYRVRATNAGGSSAYSTSGSFATTPPAPLAPVAKKVGSNIGLTWTDNSAYNTGVQVWHAADGVWDGSALATLGAVLSYTHSAPSPSVTHTYRLKQTTTTPALTSAYSPSSNVVQLLAAPLAPTKLAPSSVARDATNPITFSWQHNAVDTTDQAKFEVHYRLVGASVWDTSGTITSGTSSWTTTLSSSTYPNGVTIEWQVRTWGDYVNPSPYSATAVVPLSSPPSVLINQPDGVTPWPTSRLVATWGYNDNEANPQSAFRATLYDSAGNVIESRPRPSEVGTGGASTVTFSTPLADGGSYSVGVTAQDSTGLWSPQDINPFTVVFSPPPTPVVSVEWRPDDAASIVTVSNPPTVVGEVDATSVQVWRAIDDGEWVLLAEGLPLNATVTDFVPALGSSNWYRAIALSDLPSSAESEAVEVAASGVSGIVINGGGQFAQAVRLRAELAVNIESGVAKGVHQFAGRSRPVEWTGEQTSRVIGVSAEIIHPDTGVLQDQSTWEEIDALARLAGPHCFRDARGRRFFVSMSGASVSGLGVAIRRGVAFTLTEIDWDEPTEAT